MRMASPAPSCLSMKSDKSMEQPILFRNSPIPHLSPGQYLDYIENIDVKSFPKLEREASPAPSCLSMKSDRSMEQPILFRKGLHDDLSFPKLEREASPAPSCLSMKSDRSMEQPILFRKRLHDDLRLKLEREASPAPSCLSMKSDRSMEQPILFRKRLHDDLSASLLTEDQFRCSVCSEALREPVSIPCGHSYCRQCISTYWAQPSLEGDYVCPECSKRFSTLPELSVNTALTRVLQALQQAGYSPALPAQTYVGVGDVPCDICAGPKHRAVKSCLTCSASYCEAHVRQHYTVPALQRHHLAEVRGDQTHTDQLDRTMKMENIKQEEIMELETKEEGKKVAENVRISDVHMFDLVKENYYKQKQISTNLEQENLELRNRCTNMQQKNVKLHNICITLIDNILKLHPENEDLKIKHFSTLSLIQELEKDMSLLDVDVIVTNELLDLKTADLEKTTSQLNFKTADLEKTTSQLNYVLQQQRHRKEATVIESCWKLRQVGCVEVPALGQPIHPGMLYDCRSESFSADSLWDSDTVIAGKTSLPYTTVETDVIPVDCLEERFKALGMNQPIRASFLSGLVKVGGASKYLDHPLPLEENAMTSHSNTTLLDRRTSRMDQLPLSLLERVTQHQLQQQTATHVVMAVTYGTQAFLVFNVDTVLVEAQFLDMVMEIMSLSSTRNESPTLADPQTSPLYSVSGTFYRDHGAKRNISGYMAFQEVCRSLPKMLGPGGEKAVPLVVWLYPLEKLYPQTVRVREVSEDLLTMVERVLVECRNLERCEKLMDFRMESEEQTDEAQSLRDRLKQVKVQLREKRAELRNVLVSVRSGKKREEGLRGACDSVETLCIIFSWVLL